MRLQIYIILSLLLHVNVSVAANGQCGLSCEHGTCTLASDRQEELSAMVQSGKMIEHCVCDEGYGGVACDLPIQPCQSNGKCNNGRACQRAKATGELACECSDADGVSRFAGLMCRNPYTEYCADKYDPNESTSFCTNGGKCKSSFISAQVAPGNTTINNEYRHLGCVCPKEFYGPHCEFLKYDRESPPDNNADGNAETNTNTDANEENPEANSNEGNINAPLKPVQIEDAKVENEETNVAMIVGLSCLVAFSVLLLMFVLKRNAGSQQAFPREMHAASIGHEYPPDYASDTFSYGQTHLYPLDPNQPIPMSGRGEEISRNPYCYDEKVTNSINATHTLTISLNITRFELFR